MFGLRVNENGLLSWSNLYGGQGDDRGEAIVELDGSSLLMFGQTASFGSGLIDVFLIRTDINGEIPCNKLSVKADEESVTLQTVSTSFSYSHGGVTGFPQTQVGHPFMEETLLCTATVGLQENSKEVKAEVYPNPTQSMVMVRTDQQIKQVYAVSLTGGATSVPWKQKQDAVQIELGVLETGCYVVQLHSQSTVITAKACKL